MKTVHFCTTDSGGAFKAASRINEAMKRCGADSGLYVRTKFHQSSACSEVIDTSLKSFVSKSKNALNLMLSKGEVITDAFGTDISRLDCVKEADAVFLHWVNSFVTCKTVGKLAAQNKPVFWVMHDMWLYTGGCHSDYDCGRYEKGCGLCPQIKSSDLFDISRRNYVEKKKQLESSGIFLVSPSQWNLDCAGRSGICAGLDGIVINNPIDIGIYKPDAGGEELRNRLMIGQDDKVILFGAMGDSVHKWEGMNMIKEAILRLPDELRQKTVLLIFGNGPEIDISSFPVKTRALGFISDEKILASLYDAADAFVSPSLADNYPNTLLEAVCCGTPCVCFDTGGMGEIVIREKTGYTARPGDTEDMSRGIELVLKSDLKKKLSDPAFNDFIKNNNYDNIGRKYIELCNERLKSRIAGVF